jgi:hypothetical protein
LRYIKTLVYLFILFYFIFFFPFFSVMEVAAGEYGEDKVRQLKSAVADGHCEPFQEEFGRQHSSGSVTPSDRQGWLNYFQNFEIEKEPVAQW